MKPWWWPRRNGRWRVSKPDYKADLEQFLSYAPRALGLNWTVQPEFRFHTVRRWRFDWIWVDERGEPTMIAVEFDGVMMRTVGHNGLAGILRDSEKINHAQALGWQVFRANAKSVGDGTFFALMDNVLIERARVAA